MIRTLRILLSVVALSTFGCRHAEPRGDVNDELAIPAVVAAERSDPVFAYVTTRYDRDDDGVVTRDEYDRTGADFDRLDRTMDGILTADDFAPTGRRVRGIRSIEGQRLRGLHLIAWYLQNDPDPRSVGRAEVHDAWSVYDRNTDGRVGRREFEAIAEDRACFGIRPAGARAGLLEVETTDPWEELVSTLDRDDDGFVTALELDSFYAENASDWTFAPEHAVPPARSLVGRTAPDFTLSMHDSDRRVTLSDYAGDRPVALIFGSYT